jgi:hypothetical protein
VLILCIIIQESQILLAVPVGKAQTQFTTFIDLSLSKVIFHIVSVLFFKIFDYLKANL